MPKNINEFKTFVEFVSNKVQSGNSVTIPQFNEVAMRAQMQVFKRDYDIFWDTKVISDFLLVFLKNTSLTINAIGEANLPSDYQHTATLRSYFIPTEGNPFEVEIKEELNADWGKLQASQLFVSNFRWPKCSYIGTKVRFLPRTLGIAQLDYFRLPLQPIWNYTVVAGEAVYSASGSVNFEWDDDYTNQVAAAYLALIGCNLKDTELAQFSELYKQQTA